MKYICPSCRNQFMQPFVCTTCGAQKLHGREMDTLEAELKRMRPVYKAAMHRWLVLGKQGKYSRQYMAASSKEDRACASAEQHLRKP